MALRMKSFALATVATAALVACGGGGGGDTSSSGFKISGGAYKGPLLGATVTAYEITTSGRSEIGTTTTSLDDGTFSLNLPGSTSNPVCLEVMAKSGSEMLDDTDTKKKITLSQDLTMSSCAPAGSNKIGINPFTDLAAKSLGNEITNESIQRANSAAALIAGTDPLTADFNNLQKKLSAIYGNGEFDCGIDKNQLCGIASLNSAYSDAINEFVKNADADELRNKLEDRSKNSDLKPDTESDAWKNFGKIADNDPRYGNGGKVISAGTAFPLQDVPTGVTPVKTGYFLFEIKNSQDFATAQFYTAGKIPQGEGKEGYDFTRFSVQTSDNWKTEKWSEVRYGKQFDNGNVLVTCQAPNLAGNSVGSEQTIVAISEKAKVVTDYKFSYGKTLVEYSCGVDQEDWQDFASNNKSPFDFTWETHIDKNGNVEVDDGKFVNVSSLFDKNGYREIGDSDGTDYETYATAYELNGNYYVLFKDRDEERDGNSSRYGVALGVFK